ncbi:hypothetical protein CRYUN_Cryun16bG0123500 [Craigia yunnanensis]
MQPVQASSLSVACITNSETISVAEFDAEVNELEVTALFTAAEKGNLDVVKELLQYTTKKGISLKNQSGFDPLHIAANQGHQGTSKIDVLAKGRTSHCPCAIGPGSSKTVGQANATPLVSTATRGHTTVVNELLSKDPSLLEISKANGKNPLHFAARQGHVNIVKAFLDKDPQLARRTDKKGEIALTMAVKGISCEIVNELLHLSDTSVNALTRGHKTALDIAAGLPLSKEIAEIKESLSHFGAVRANELNQPRDELRKTVTEIKKDVHTQLEQTRKTNRNVNGIAMELRKLHRAGINNAINSVTVVAVLFETVAFAAIFTVPGDDNDYGMAVVVSKTSFKIFFLSNATALFTSLAVVLVQITLVRGETKSERRVVEVINNLMWLASV